MREPVHDTTERDSYPPGAACWVELRERDLRGAMAFYAALFHWTLVEPGGAAGSPRGEYYVAQIRERDVAGLGVLHALPEALPPAWTTYVRVTDVEASADRAVTLGGAVLIGPTDAQPAGRLAIVRDPGGAIIGLWEALSREGAQLVNQAQTWALSVLFTDQPELSTPFYTGMFGWIPEPFGSTTAQSTLWHLPSYFGGTAGQPVARDVVGMMSPVGAATRHIRSPCWSVDFWVDSVDATAERVEQLGGRVLVTPHDTPGFRSGIVEDPAGAEFSISQPML